MTSNDKQNDDSELACEFCNGFYGPTSGDPVCSVCHVFIFEQGRSGLSKSLLKDKDASDDSGNEDGEEKSVPATVQLPAMSQHQHSHSAVVSCVSSSQQHYHCPTVTPPLVIPPPSTSAPDEVNYLESVPTEILLRVIRALDDIALWSLRFTSARLRAIVDDAVPDEQWRLAVQHRWPLHNNCVPGVLYRDLYSNLIQSMTCRTCWQRIWDSDKPVTDCSQTWFSKRVRLESDILSREEQYGITALCLDEQTQSSWMAAIVGPPGSGYEGGLFYLHVRVPPSYPLQPPRIQFLTRLAHPNVSKHGDIGLDLLHSNWSLALTISKLLISIQSLLTDPNTTVCMEPDMGALYSRDPARFRQVCTTWTWKYAMHDYLPPQIVQNISID